MVIGKTYEFCFVAFDGRARRFARDATHAVEHAMSSQTYSAEEMLLLRQAFDDALSVMMRQHIDIPTASLARRIFDAASSGERDRHALRRAALGAFAHLS